MLAMFYRDNFDLIAQPIASNTYIECVILMKYRILNTNR